jgi:hypothetical protein
VVLVESGIVFAKYMYLWGGDPGGFQIAFDNFQIIEVVAYIVVAFHAALSLISLANMGIRELQTITYPGCSETLPAVVPGVAK